MQESNDQHIENDADHSDPLSFQSAGLLPKERLPSLRQWLASTSPSRTRCDWLWVQRTDRADSSLYENEDLRGNNMLREWQKIVPEIEKAAASKQDLHQRLRKAIDELAQKYGIMGKKRTSDLTLSHTYVHTHIHTHTHTHHKE